MFGSTSATSASQYLHPDYLSPLPTTLDAKKSPLALLAQTCNSIGKDISPGRPALKTTSSSSSLKDPKDRDSRASKDSPWGSKDHGSKVKDDVENCERPPVNSPVADSKSEESEARTVQNTTSVGFSRSCSDGLRTGPTSAGSGKSSTPVAAPNSSCVDHRNSTVSHRKFSPKEKTIAGSRSVSQPVRPVVASASSPKKDSRETEETWLDRSLTSSPKTSRFGAGDVDVGSSSGALKTDRKTTRYLAASPGTSTEPFAHFRQTTSSSSPAIGDCLSPLVLSYLTGVPQYAGHLLPPGSLDPLTKFPSTSLSAYLAYLQSRSGLVPCKDPFCTECPTAPPPPPPFPSMAVFDKSLTGPSLRPPFALPPPERPCPTGHVTLDTLSALYTGSLGGSTLSPPGLPCAWACPWVTTEGEYCGKRCSSAEELLVHTRSHWPSSRLSPSSGLHSIAGLSGWIGYHPYYPFAPSVNSMALLRHAYSGGTRNLSPATGLFSLGASGGRYHPYKSPSTSISLSSPPSSFDLYSNQRTMGATAP